MTPAPVTDPRAGESSASSTNPDYDIAVIGAGPAGLALGRELRQRAGSLRFCLLERGGSPGESWRQMPRELKLVSPWKSSRLPGPPIRPWHPHREVTRTEFFDYLNDYATANDLPIRLHTEVIGIRPDASPTRTSPGSREFTLETTAGAIRCRRVVNATGYFQNPILPEWAALDQGSSEPIGRAPLQWHSAHFHDSADLARQLGRSPEGAPARILIVGHRLSAGQLLVELHDAGFSVALSHRAPIRFGSGPVGQWIFFRILPWIEAARLRLQGRSARGFEVRMQGGRARQLIEAGAVTVFPAVSERRGDTIRFANGATFKPDAILFATGFRPALNHLGGLAIAVDSATGSPVTNKFQSVSIPGLYFLGIDRARNFQSRFLRGIRQDAALVAELLVTDLNHSKRRSP